VDEPTNWSTAINPNSRREEAFANIILDEYIASLSQQPLLSINVLNQLLLLDLRRTVQRQFIAAFAQVLKSYRKLFLLGRVFRDLAAHGLSSTAHEPR
jgi:hypothetical protein